jgi:hypothetical protein
MAQYSIEHTYYLQSGGYCPSTSLVVPSTTRRPYKPHKAKISIIGRGGTRRAAVTVLTQLMAASSTPIRPAGPLNEPGLQAVCSVCGGTWPVIAPPPRREHRRVVPGTAPSSPPTRPTRRRPLTGAAALPNPLTEASVRRRSVPRTTGPFRVLGVSETKRVYEDDGDEPKYVDNLKSDVKFKRTIRATRRWTQSIQLQTQSARESGTSGSLGLSTIFTAELRQTLLQRLSTTYSASSEMERVFEDTFEVEVPPRTRMQIMLHWKRVVQIGKIRIRSSDLKVIEVPFRIVIDLAVDPENATQSIKKKS